MPDTPELSTVKKNLPYQRPNNSPLAQGVRQMQNKGKFKQTQRQLGAASMRAAATRKLGQLQNKANYRGVADNLKKQIPEQKK
jgi:hypothetical protein